MPKKQSFIKKLIIGAGAEFRENPIKFSLGVAAMLIAVGISYAIFFGGVNLKAKHGDTTVELTTQAKQ